MSFDLRVEIYVNGAWNDISADVQQSSGVQITRGQQGTGVTQDASTCAFMLDNTSGNYSPDNPLGAYYGSIGRNTLCRVSVPVPSTHLELLGDFGGNVSSAGLGITDNITITIEMDAMLTAVQGTQILAQQYTSGDTANQAWQFYYSDDGFLHFDWYDSSAVLHQSQCAYSATPGRALQVVLNPSMSGNHIITFSYSDSVDGTFQTAATITRSGTTSIHSTTTALLTVGGDNTDADPDWGSVVGYVRKFRVVHSGVQFVNADFTSLTAGTTTFTDSTAQVWTVNGSAYVSDRDYRFGGTVASWPVAWVVNWVYVNVTGGSIRRRLGQGAKSILSALTQRVPSYAPLAYWPMEDGVDSTSFSTGLLTGTSATFTGFSLAADSSLSSAKALPTINTAGGTISSSLQGSVPLDPTTTQSYVTTTKTFTSSTTWTVPTGVTTAKVECWGAGGGGQGGSGAAGGGGEYARSDSVAVTPGESLTVTIGAGGSGGPGGAGGPGSNGGDTTLKRSSTTLVIAHGGKGSNSSTTAGGSGSTAPVHYNGGGSHANTTGTSTGGAGGGSSAGSGAAGNTGASNSGSTGGAGASAPTNGGSGGRGGNGTGTSGTAGAAGSAPGGGGGTGGAGSSSNSAGGAGAHGQVKVTYTAPGAPLIGGNWSTFFVVKVPNAVTAYHTYMVVTTAGSAVTWQLQVGPSDSRMVGTASDGTTLVSQTMPTPSNFIGNWFLIQIFNSQSSSTVNWGVLWTDLNGITTEYDNSFTGTAAYVVSVGTGAGTYSSELDGTALGHLAVFNTSSSDAYTATGFNASSSPLTAYNGEYSSERACRVASENRIPLRHLGVLTDQQRVGPQPMDTPLNVMDAAASTDAGILVEDRAQIGLVFKDTSTIYQQTPTVVDYSQLLMGLTPTRDDTLIVNSYTATRIGGGSGQAQLDDGSPLSISDPPVGVGLYDSSSSFSLYQDSQTNDIAAWRVHVGTIDQPRYLAVQIELAKYPSLVDSVGALDVGSRLQITNCPFGKTPPGTQDLLIIGYQEHIDHFLHTMSYNCVPYTPYLAAYTIPDFPVDVSRADAEGSTLASAALATDQSISVATVSQPWTNTISSTVTDYPFDLTIAGEQMTVGAPGTVLNLNPDFESGVTDWTATSATVAQSSVVSKSGSFSGLLTSASGANPRVEAGQQPVVVGNFYVAMGWLYTPTTIPNPVAINVNWYTSGHVYISTSSVSFTITPGVWTPVVNVTYQAPASAAFAGILWTISGTPGAGYLLYADSIRLVDPSTAAATTSPQTMQVLRGINGFTKALPIGSSVNLTYPAYVPL